MTGYQLVRLLKQADERAQKDDYDGRRLLDLMTTAEVEVLDSDHGGPALRFKSDNITFTYTLASSVRWRLQR